MTDPVEPTARAGGAEQPRDLLEQYHLLADSGADIVLEVDADWAITWVSPSVRQMLGWRVADLLGAGASDLVCDEDAAAMRDWSTLVYQGEAVGPVQVRYRTSAGELRWMVARARPRRDDAGTIVTAIVALRDCQSEVVARRALSTLSAGSRILAHADREDGLLNEMCQTAVDQGGYMLAWYARRIDDAAHTVTKIASSRKLRDYVDGIEVDWSDGPLGRGPTGRAIRSGEVVVIEDTLADADFAPWRAAASEHGFRSCVALPVRVDGVIDGSLLVYATEPRAFNAFVVGVLSDLTSQLGHGLRRLRDHERLVELTREQALLSTAIDQAAEAVIVTDPAGAILYANPAALQASRYPLEEVLGANPRIFQSGLHDAAFYDAMWARLLGGETWRGVIVNRRKDGELWEAETTISPIYDGDGNPIAYVAVKRDLTVVRSLEAEITQGHRDRGTLLGVMQAVRPAATLSGTAFALCQSAIALEAIESAVVLLVQEGGTLLPVGSAGIVLAPFAEGRQVSVDDARILIERTAAGPWWLALTPRSTPDRPFITAAFDAGLRASAHIPIRWEGRLIGVLTLSTMDPDAHRWMDTRLGAFEQFGSYGGALFGAQADLVGRREALAAEIRTTIGERRFRPVFQPIVDLRTGDPVGYEALTRFHDGRPPQTHFTEAVTAGLGPELESACVSVALTASRALPPSIWVAVNFSPATLVSGRVAESVRGADREIVLEITEHAQVESYPAVRRAVREIPHCRMSIDDAGAGYTSLRHILELEPDFVKLDISLVRDNDTNRARQAMIAGMCHFAGVSGTTLIAEGIETRGEAAMLRTLGAGLGERGILGQGYLFGRPAPLP